MAEGEGKQQVVDVHSIHLVDIHNIYIETSYVILYIYIYPQTTVCLPGAALLTC